MELDIIYNEDCLKGLKELPDHCIDLVVTDPPYLISATNGGGTVNTVKKLNKSLQDLKNWSEGEQNFIKGIIKFAKKFHESIPPKLKKCPFCGQTPTLDLNGDQFIVECDCGCVVGSFDSKWDAVASWNIRVGKRRG